MTLHGITTLPSFIALVYGNDYEPLIGIYGDSFWFRIQI